MKGENIMAKQWSKVIPLEEGHITVSEVIINAENNNWDLAEINYVPSKNVQNSVNPHLFLNLLILMYLLLMLKLYQNIMFLC